MTIYVGHSNDFDYINKLYKPLKTSKLLKAHQFFFPHDEVGKEVKTKDIIRDYDLVIAEVSLPSTGLGIELGWAENAETKILCIHEKGAKYSSALKFITNSFIEYENEEGMINKITYFIENGGLI